MKNNGSFPWGEIIKVHRIGEHEITEYHPWIDGNYDRAPNQDEVLFSVEPKKNHYYYEDSLDKALIALVCLKYDGINTRLPEYIIKALGMDEEGPCLVTK